MTTNMAASVRARLANRARESGRPFQELLQYYGLERFLYRLSQSRHREKFVLKGALMLRVWEAPLSRPTRDIDLLGFIDNRIDTLEEIFREVCVISVENDGLRFDPENVNGERIKEDADYEGVRVKFKGFLERAQIPMQIDIGFGDVVHPPPKERHYPVILEFPKPRLRSYSRESVIAEKFEALTALGELNSRMKDFFDIWLLSRLFDFDGAQLAQAIEITFAQRETVLEVGPVGLSEAFMLSEATQIKWAAFRKRSKLEEAPQIFNELGIPIRQFLLPVVEVLAENKNFVGTWVPPGPWYGGS